MGERFHATRSAQEARCTGPVLLGASRAKTAAKTNPPAGRPEALSALVRSGIYSLTLDSPLRTTQKLYFRANCICLGLLDVLVTLPTVALSMAVVGPLK